MNTIVKRIQRRADQFMGKHAKHARQSKYGGTSHITRGMAASALRLMRKMRQT